ncbi:hypothetical protein SUGI_0668050 [Cryptomeria japonica]|uniref:SKP1-like protein 1A n=1 Tax=Cryptomeria japonica TaxID=3369 RepID=UPI00241497D5|nr:SKP1-like protein 1A [Cryptomeria japonica]GLJ33180.1 hypothetical protein SUGI_0668050 [Cryptomeria japonica]
MAEDPNTAVTKECKLKLKSSDDKIFEVDCAVAEQSKFLKNILEDIGTEKAVPLPNVSSEILAKVIEYCEYHVNAANTISELDVKKWDQELVRQMDYATLFHLLKAAKYLDVYNFLDLVCQTIADRIKWKSPEAMRKIFNIENDFTPEEEAEVRRDVQWAFE